MKKIMKTLKNRDREEVKRAKAAIQGLKELGYKVNIKHYRIGSFKYGELAPLQKFEIDKDDRDFLNGGHTWVGIAKVKGEGEADEYMNGGSAYCHPEKDNFNRWAGISLALTKAMGIFPKSERKAIWGYSEAK